MVNLNKSEVMKKVDLSKKVLDEVAEELAFPDDLIDVHIVLDRSGSMKYLYSSGVVYEVLIQLMAFGLKFDWNKELELTLFDSEARELEKVTVNNLHTYQSDNIDTVRYGCSTMYAPPLNHIYDNYKNMDSKVFVIFITDGNNFDSEATLEVLKKLSITPVFIKFIGIGSEHFTFLRSLDNLQKIIPEVPVDNINFKHIKDIANIPLKELYSLIFEEYEEWSEAIDEFRRKNPNFKFSLPEPPKPPEPTRKPLPTPSYNDAWSTPRTPKKKGWFAKLIDILKGDI